MAKLLYPFVFSFVLSISLFGQDTTKHNSSVKEFFPHYSSYTPGITVNFQALKYQSIGLGTGAIHPTGMCEGIGWGVILNHQFTFKNANGDFTYSPQISVYANISYVYAGLNISYETNFNDGGNFGVNPEVGIGFYYIYITYSRHFSIIDNISIPTNKDNISLKLLIPTGHL